MRAETLAFFEEVVWKQQRPLADLLHAQVTYATPRLAEFYGLSVHSGEELARYDRADVPERGGLLTQGSVLTVGGDEASTVTRGLFMLNGILRGAVNNPPPGLDTRPVPAKPGLSKRDVAQQRIDNRTCGACHARFETLAFAFEKYDGMGAFHERDEHGNPLREDGEVLFPGEAAPIAYQTANELARLLAGHERVRENLTRKLIQFSKALRAHAHMKMRELAYFLKRLDAPDTREANGKTILENSLITISTESGDGRHNDSKRELSGVFHAITGANGRFKTGQILEVGAERLDLYNTMLGAMGASRRLGPADREMKRVEAICA